jgi:CRISPR-associated protein Csm5
MKEYKLKLTTLSPVHIGTGEDYEPTNFVIDDGYLYEFDEIAFYQKLSPNMKDKFNQIVSSNTQDSLFQIHSLVKNNLNIAKEVSHLKVPVSKGIEKDYENKIGRLVQNEGRRGNTKSVFNRFQIARTSRLVNSAKAYIPGSSLKGALSTAYQEGYYKKGYKEWKANFGKPLDNIF